MRQCKSLKAHGFDVSIITNDGDPDEILDGIPIFDCKKTWPRWKTLLFAKRQFMAKALEINADIYQLHSPELLSLGLSLKKAGKRVVYDAHEDMPRHIMEKEWLPRGSRQAISIMFEKYMMSTLSKYDEIISPHFHVIDKMKLSFGKGIAICNFPILSINDYLSVENYCNRDNIICYSGTVYDYSNQEEVLLALERLPETQYRIAGYIEESHCQRLMDMPSGDRVKFLGRLSRSDLHEFYQASLVGLVVYDYKLNLGDRLGSYGTNKIFEYMEAGIPFIATDYLLWKDIVDRYECGICVTPGRSDEIAAAIEFLLNDRERAYWMGQNGRRAVFDEFNWASEEKKYVGLFRRLAEYDTQDGKKKTDAD